MGQYLQKFERLITWILIAMMAVVVALSVVDLAWLLIKDIISPPILLLDADELLELFGFFLLIMIGIELLETLRTYVHKREIRTEVIILVALIALGRKVVIIDVKGAEDISLLGIAAMILALAISFYLIKRTHNNVGSEQSKHSPTPVDGTGKSDHV
jgi:uncharacterized membrane protein (DUF373 family)